MSKRKNEREPIDSKIIKGSLSKDMKVKTQKMTRSQAYEW